MVTKERPGRTLHRRQCAPPSRAPGRIARHVLGGVALWSAFEAMSDHDIGTIGMRRSWGDIAPSPFRIPRAVRPSHLVCIGKSGTGKTTLMERLFLADVLAGHGAALIDPHGDSAARLLEHIPPSRHDHVCYFDPADLSYPVGLNPLSGIDPERRELAVAGVVSAFKSYWGASWGPRLEYLLVQSVSALAELPGATLLLLPRLLSDEEYRARVAVRLSDPVVRQFWSVRFPGWDKRYRTEATEPVLNKVDQLFIGPTVRNVFAQESSKFDPRFALDNRRIFIANLSKGRVGEGVANLLASLIVSRFELAAQSRADLPEEERADFYLYADEYQNIANEGSAKMLSEDRKYRLNLSLFHQYVDQLEEGVRAAVFGNVGTIISFRVGSTDAAFLEREFDRQFSPEDLTSLDQFEVAIKTVGHDGRPIVPFRARTLPMDAWRYDRGELVRRRSRRHFARHREKVERAVARAAAPSSSQARPKRDQRKVKAVLRIYE